ncbi:MAG: outer membrane lipid asymmetry maintenance protein MlaD [Magnetococcales bacterium]|nr:outer membrane lipid asymmetry maintenance protein MlaD [Magnetococcales bacterium]MBF0157885.1 outer membrane lipid asymmetry maintenance protein MlaD [Magnetococcales bacterium]
MQNAKLEFAVGLFVLLGILALSWLSIRLARMEMIGGNYVPIVASFGSISGLRTGASVEIAGVEVGRVSGIELDTKEFEARVHMRINAGVPIQEDAIASIRTKGLIGDRYITISPGASEKNLGPNEQLVQTESAINFEELISQFIHGSVQ